MNDDSDESEYVDDNASGSDTRAARGKTAKVKKALKKDPKVNSEAARGSSAAVEDLTDTANHDGSHSTTTTTTKSVLRSYRDHLNSTILEIAGNEEDFNNHDTLEPSQIGASLWTTQEKNKFFTTLKSCGPGNLLALATAVGTKSQPEIKAYILLLQQGVGELQAKSRLELASADLPAAAEISAECLRAEEAAAAVLEAKARAVEEEREKIRWGEEDWLIDEDVAAAFDAKYEEQDNATEQDETVEDDANADSTARTSNSPNNSPPPTPLQLLKASTLLQLSRTVFMNSRDPSSNWHSLIEEEEEYHSQQQRQGPSIRRTALSDLHNLTVSLTRRLMQVSIFQALSRLRASSDPRVQPNVHVFDVVAARETLGLKAGGAEYWARAVAKSGVDVYADAKRFRAESGRRGTKFGYRLSEEELRVELRIPGLGSVKRGDGTSISKEEEDDDDDIDLDLEDPDSDAYTETGSSDEQSLHSDDNNDDGDDDDEDLSDKQDGDRHRRTGSKNRPLHPRKRPLSPASFAKAETRHLETLDRAKSTAEENRLRSILGLESLPDTKKEEQRLEFPYKQAKGGKGSGDVSWWGDGVEYRAVWEQGGGLPGKEEFERMGIEGGRRRKRRRLMMGGGERVGEKVGGVEGVEGSGGEEDEEEIVEGEDDGDDVVEGEGEQEEPEEEGNESGSGSDEGDQ